MGSVRTQMIATNMLLLAMLLVTLGLIVRYSVREMMLHSIDTELISRARRPGPDRPPPRRPDDHNDNYGNGAPMQGAGFDPNDPNSDPQHRPGDGEPPGQDPNRDPGRPQGDEGTTGQNPTTQVPVTQRRLGEDRRAAIEVQGSPPHMQSPADDGGYHPVLLHMDGTNVDIRAGRKGAWDIASVQQVQKLAKQERLTRAGVFVIGNVTLDTLPFRLITMARTDQHLGRAIAQIPYPLTDVYRATDQLDRALLTLIPIGLIFAAGAGWYLTGRVLKRVGTLAASAESMGTGNLSQRLPIIGDDEFSDLATTFNGMLSRLETVFRNQERLLDQQRRFTADASHELKTPLTIIRGNASLALRSGEDLDEMRQSIQEIDAAANTMSQLVQDLLLLARSESVPDKRKWIEAPLIELIDQAVAGARRPGSAPIILRLDDPDVCVSGSEEELVRLLKNLLDNAIRYTPVEGSITVTATHQGENVVVTVHDTGEGIAPEHLPHLGERFYRIDSSRSRPTGGTGLGLSICKGIVEAHGGSLQFKSEPGVGTTVIVTLPVTE